MGWSKPKQSSLLIPLTSKLMLFCTALFLNTSTAGALGKSTAVFSRARNFLVLWTQSCRFRLPSVAERRQESDPAGFLWVLLLWTEWVCQRPCYWCCHPHGHQTPLLPPDLQAPALTFLCLACRHIFHPRFFMVGVNLWCIILSWSGVVQFCSYWQDALNPLCPVWNPGAWKSRPILQQSQSCAARRLLH